MKNVLQVTTTARGMENFDLWVDMMDVPPTVNNLEEFLAVAKQDFGGDGRKVRIVQLFGEDK